MKPSDIQAWLLGKPGKDAPLLMPISTYSYSPLCCCSAVSGFAVSVSIYTYVQLFYITGPMDGLPGKAGSRGTLIRVEPQ